MREFEYKIDQLNTDIKRINRLLGISDSDTTTPLAEVVKIEIDKLGSISDIRGGFKIFEDFKLNDSLKSIKINGEQFSVGEEIYNNLHKSEKIVAFVYTAGEGYTEQAAEYNENDMHIQGYITDVLGNMVLEAISEKFMDDLKMKFCEDEQQVSNQYCPGYCDWDIREQKKLFSLFPKGFCGISLSDSALMIPVKSVSGFIGIGSNVKFSKYKCSQCKKINCIYRGI